MRFLHLNIHGWADSHGIDNTEGVTQLIDDQAPDVVSLVEVDEPFGDPVRLRAMAERLGYCWAFVPAFEYRGEGGFGNALLSKEPLRWVQQWDLLSPRLYDGTEPSEPRTLLTAGVIIDDQEFTVGSTHLPRYQEDQRVEATQTLRRLLAGLSEPWAICGDFNQPSRRMDMPGYCIAPECPTYPTGGAEEAIDFCISSRKLTGEVLEDPSLSDHFPILATTEAT